MGSWMRGEKLFMKLSYIVVLIFLVCNTLYASENGNEKIVVISDWFQHSDNDAVMLGVSDIVNKAYITTDSKEIKQIKSAMRKYKRGPAFLCGYDLIFLYFSNDILYAKHKVNIKCSKESVDDFFEQYELIKSYNATLYTLKLNPGNYSPDVVKRPQSGACFKYEKINAAYPSYSVRFFNRNSDDVHKEKLRELIDTLEILFPEKESLRHSSFKKRLDSYGRAKVILPIGFDSTKIDSIRLPEIYKTTYDHPQYSYLYLVANNTSVDELRLQNTFDGLLSIDVRDVKSDKGKQ